MKRFLSCLVTISFVLNSSICLAHSDAEAHSHTKSSSSIGLKANDGGAIVYGSVLKPRENRLKVKLPANIFKAIRTQGIENASFVITKIASENETSVTCAISSSDVDVIGKNLFLEVVPCTDATGSTVTAGALAAGTYTLTVSIGNLQTAGTFEFKPPAVVVGSVDSGDGSCSGGTNAIKSISGSSLSQVVALSTNCNYYNEVQAQRAQRVAMNKNRSFHVDGATEDTSGDGVFYEDPGTGIETDIAISEATVVTIDNDGFSDVQELSAPVNLDPNLNGSAVNIDENTTEVVETAEGLVFEDVNDDGAIDQTDIDKAKKDSSADESFQAFNDALDDSVVIEEISDEASSGGDTEPNTVTGTPFTPSNDCGEKLSSLVSLLPEDPKLITDDQYKILGQQVIPGILSGDLKVCLPPFLPQFINDLTNRLCGNLPAQISPGAGPLGLCDKAAIEFARKFLFKIREQLGNQKNPQGPDPKEVCNKLKGGLSNQCKGTNCPPPPCFPDEIKSILKTNCPELLVFVPDSKCEVPPPVCGLDQSPKQPLPSQINSPNQCVGAKGPEQPSICKPCKTGSALGTPDGCFGPELQNITASNGESCTLPTVECVELTSLGITPKSGEPNNGICVFTDGMGNAEPPKDPNTCKPFPQLDVRKQCSANANPVSCGISEDGILQEGFDIRCCRNPQGPKLSPNSKKQTSADICAEKKCDDGDPCTIDGCDPNTGCISKPNPECTGSGKPPENPTITTAPIGEFVDCVQNPTDPKCQKQGGEGVFGKGTTYPICVLQKLCSDPNNFDNPDFGKAKADILQAVIEKCKLEAEQGQNNGQNKPGKPQGGQCPETCKQADGSISDAPECKPCFGNKPNKPGQPQGGQCPETCKQADGSISDAPECKPCFGTKPPSDGQPQGGQCPESCKKSDGSISDAPECKPCFGPKPPSDGQPQGGQCPETCKKTDGSILDAPECKPCFGTKPPSDGQPTQGGQCPETCKKSDGSISDAPECKPCFGTKPPTTGACPEGQVRDPNGICKPASGSSTGTCPEGQVKDPSGICKPISGGTQPPLGGTTSPTTCPAGQIKDPATGQCRPA